MRSKLKAAAVGAVSVAAVIAVSAPAFAVTNTYGPQNWSNGTTSGRYRAHTGTHYILAKGCSGRVSIDLRVDVINNPDISEGYYSYACGSTGMLTGHVDSYGSPYRGHFMQSHSQWYGTLSDNHP